MEKIDRSKFYKKPLMFGAQTLYESEILSNISLKHWEEFDKSVQSENGLKIGDFINVAVSTTAIQLIKFLDEFMQCETIHEFKTKASVYIEEIQKEVELKNE